MMSASDDLLLRECLSLARGFTPLGGPLRPTIEAAPVSASHQPRPPSALVQARHRGLVSRPPSLVVEEAA